METQKTPYSQSDLEKEKMELQESSSLTSHYPTELQPCLLKWLTFIVCAVASVFSDSLWPHGPQHARLLCPWNFPGKNTGVGCHFPLQGILLPQESKPGLLHWQADSLSLRHQGSPAVLLQLSECASLLGMRWLGGREVRDQQPSGGKDPSLWISLTDYHLTSCVTISQLLNLSKPQFPPLWIIYTYILKLCWILWPYIYIQLFNSPNFVDTVKLAQTLAIEKQAP